MMTIKEASKMAGISVRTLQYYDKIGLLKPAKYTDSKYRLYDEGTMEKLQQILLFKELEFSLREIKEIITKPHFDKERALEQQIKLLIIKKERLENLITHARGLNNIGGNKMDFTMFECKDNENAKKGREVLRRILEWGDEDKDVYKTGLEKIFGEFGEIKNTDPASKEAQNLVRQFQEHLTKCFGVEYSDELLYTSACSLTAKGVLEEEEKVYGEGTMDFIYQATKIYCGK